MANLGHYLRERNHQGLGNRLLDGFPQDADGPSVECRERLGGLLQLLVSCGWLSRYVRVPSEPPHGLRIVVALTSAGGPSNPRFAQIRSSTLHRPTSSSTYYLHHTGTSNSRCKWFTLRDDSGRCGLHQLGRTGCRRFSQLVHA